MTYSTSEYASTPGKLKSLPDHGGNRTHDLWDTTVVQCSRLPTELRGQVGSGGDISELSLVPSISICSKI